MTSSNTESGSSTPPRTISLLVSDIDGTLVRPDKSVAPATIEAVRRLGENGIAFAIVSARPPRGMMHLVEALNVTTPIAGFNGGMMVDRSGQELRRLSIAADTARDVVAALDAKHVDVWVFDGNEWLVRFPDGDYVARETKTIRYSPVTVADFGSALQSATKIVGVSKDFDLLAQAETELKNTFGHAASIALSQRYYLDITHTEANKGSAVLSFSQMLGIPTTQIATIGDMSNDVRMFQQSAFSIAMGNASDDVKRQANVATDSNDNDGMAKAIERYILPNAPDK